MTSTDAEVHIRRLRRELNPRCHPRFASMIANALELITRQLYDRSTHFIHEFLQNMDDTAYEDGVTPAVKFTYKNGRLRVDSNQIGFRAEDIDAICSIGSSTKVNLSDSAQSIGEKGVGFKSVFRVANKVWLSSRSYSIRWDRSAKLGAIAPEWASFPEEVADGQTSFLSELDRNEQEEQILSDLENFDASLILFLNKIRRIDIEVLRHNGQCRTKTIVRRDIENVDFHTSVIQDGGVESFYFMSTFTAINLPAESRRHGVSSSELQLAFPLHQQPNKKPSTMTHNVYSGLPIGNYGLRFLLNADFIVTASRQSIDISLAWNVALRDALPLALIHAFDRLGDNSPCKYTWPWFAAAAAPSTFFEPALETARQTLASKRTLRSLEGQLELPTKLTYVDLAKFAGDDGCPMTMYCATKTEYLSLEYPAWTIDSIIDLGVSRLTVETFLRDLHNMITDDACGFHGRPSKWHEDLAAVLLPQVDVPGLEGAIRQLDIIPLLDGSWTNSLILEGERSPQPVFWPANIDLHGSEAKLPFSVVDSKSLEGLQRRKLFERLDIVTLDAERICDGILAAHTASGSGSFSDSSTIGDLELISHAHLLHRESWKPKIHQPSDLWLASADGRRHRGSDLYIMRYAEGASQSTTATDILHDLSPKLHSDYLNGEYLRCHSASSAYSNTSAYLDDFVTYLIGTFRISTVPRLVHFGANACDYFLADGFARLFDKHHASHILQLILDNWNYYSPWIELNEPHSSCEACLTSRTRLLQRIRKLPSQSEHGSRSKILNTVLPDLDPFIQSSGVPLAVVKVSNFTDLAVRYRLQCLGVITRKGLAFYLQCLNAMKEQDSPSERHVAHVYQQIQAYYSEGRAQVQDAFFKNGLIFLNLQSAVSGETFRGWKNISECIKLGVRLETVYPRSADLFRTLQSADGLEVEEIVAGLVSLSTAFSDDLLPSLIKSLGQLSKTVASLSCLGVEITLGSLASMQIFPVNMGDSYCSTTLRSSKDQNWYIADRPQLRESFKGKVPLLDVPAHEADQMEILLSYLGLRSRKLSLCVTTKTCPKGQIKLRAADTTILQSRAPFLEALVPPSNWRKRTVSDYILNATVSTAAEIVDEHTLNDQDMLRGRRTRSQAVCKVEEGQLRLFVSAKSPSAVPLIHLSEHLLEFCGIEDRMHVWLLHFLLTEPNNDEIEVAFAKRGLHVEVPKNSNDDAQISVEDPYWRYASHTMDLQDPLDFDGSDWQNSDEESISYDLLHSFHGKVGFRTDGVHVKPRKDRRLRLMRHHREDYTQNVFEFRSRASKRRLDPNSNLKFLGEHLISLLFQQNLEKYYDPMLCWTSPLRTRAGLPEFSDTTHHASFTISGSGITKKVTQMLDELGCEGVAQYSQGLPTYHFDVGVSAGGVDDAFEWSTSQLRMAQEYQQDDLHVLVLIRITCAYTEPKLRLMRNPWRFLSSGILQIRSNCILSASFVLNQHQDKHGGTNHFTSLSSQLNSSVNARFLRESTLDVDVPQYICDTTRVLSPDNSRSQVEQSHKFESSQLNPQTQDFATRIPEAGASRITFDLKRKRSPELSSNQSEWLPPAKRVASVPSIYQSYQYTPLRENELRLFTLFPGAGTERLRGMLWTTTSRMAGPYTTLSYVWGSDDQPVHILSTPLGNLGIRHALHAALVSLRKRREPLTLWVDALCIDQADKREKSHQITLLAEIFQRSECTLAFIDGDEEHREAIQMLMQVRACMVLGPTSDKWPEDLPRCPESWNERGMPFPDDEIWARVASFFDNPWFRRTWIVQEAVIARKLNIVHGKMQVDWNHLFLVMDHIEKHLERDERTKPKSWIPFLKLGRLRHIEDRSGRISILKLLENFRHTKSSDPRDKFFSLLGIASDGNLEDFEPDYCSSLAQITQRFATALYRRFSEKKQAMLLLNRAGLSQRDNLPSWVPDWFDEKPNGLHDALGRGNAFNACDDLQEDVKYAPDTGELEVEAYLMDEVEYVTHSCNGLERSEQKRYFTEMRALLEKVFGDIRDNEKIQTVLWEAPVAGAKHPKVALPGDLSVKESWESFMKLLETDWSSEDNGEQATKRLEQYAMDQDESDLETQSRVYKSLLADEIRNWRFVILKDTYLCGIVPNTVQKGDFVHIFHGGVVPFITRKSKQREGAYRLIGQCYIWGMMEGEGTSYEKLVQETVRLH